MSKSPLEKVLRKDVIAYLNGRNIFHFRIEDQMLSNYPDMIICYRGRFVAVELKRSENIKARLGQIQVLDFIKENKGYGEVVGSMDQLTELLHRIDEDIDNE